MRKSINYVVTDTGRDNGKTYVLTEMSADKAEKWAMRALLAMVNSGYDVPQSALSGGFGGLVEVGFKGLFSIRWDLLEPLMDEMMQCVQFMPNRATPHVIRPLFDGDIEEVLTLPKLRWEILKLHADFLEPVARSVSEKMQAAGS